VSLPAVLALFAHPDDESLACGGTLAALVDAGWPVQVVYVGDGVITARAQAQDNRADATAACTVLGLPAPTFLGHPDQRLDTVAVSDLVNDVLAAAPPPDLVLSHASADLNEDHRVVSKVSRVVARPIDRPVALLECEVPANSTWNGTPMVPNWYVGITGTLDRKLTAIARYQGEARSFPHPCSPEAVEALATAHGAASGLGRAEAFRVVRGYAGLLP